MLKPSRRQSNHRPRNLTRPELEQSKTFVLNTLGFLQSRRSYERTMNEFIAWYCSEPRLALNRIVVLHYRMHLENIPLAPATINLRLAAVRRLAYEASDDGLLSPGVGGGYPPGQRREAVWTAGRQLVDGWGMSVAFERRARGDAAWQTRRRHAGFIARLRSSTIGGGQPGD